MKYQTVLEISINTIERMETAATDIFVRQVIGTNMGRLRSERNISQSKLAQMIEMNRAHLNQIEGGKQNFSMDKLVKIADGLDVPLTEFFAGLEDASPSRIAADKSTTAEE